MRTGGNEKRENVKASARDRVKNDTKKHKLQSRRPHTYSGALYVRPVDRVRQLPGRLVGASGCKRLGHEQAAAATPVRVVVVVVVEHHATAAAATVGVHRRCREKVVVFVLGRQAAAARPRPAPGVPLTLADALQLLLMLLLLLLVVVVQRRPRRVVGELVSGGDGGVLPVQLVEFPWYLLLLR